MSTLDTLLLVALGASLGAAWYWRREYAQARRAALVWKKRARMAALVAAGLGAVLWWKGRGGHHGV